MRLPTRIAFSALLGAPVLPGAAAAQPAAAQGPRFTLDAEVSGLRDSNGNRRSESSTSAITTEAVMKLGSRAVQPMFLLEYSPGYRTSAEGTRLDGVTHRALLTVAIPLSNRLGVDLVGRVRRGGADEQLDRAGEAMMRARVSLDLDRLTRVSAYGSRRWQDLGPGGTAPGFHVGGELQRRFSRATALTADVRHEELSPEDATRRWDRDAIRVAFEHDAGRIRLEVEGSGRWRTYPDRPVDRRDPQRGVRKDSNWQFGTGVVYERSATTQLRFGYEVDRRTVNSPAGTYLGHRLNVTARQRLIGGSVRRPV